MPQGVPLLLLQLPEQIRNGEQIYAARYVLATILGDTAVVSWDHQTGGCSTLRFTDPQNFQEVCSTPNSFAAILADGSLVTWGDPGSGGDSTAVQNQLIYL